MVQEVKPACDVTSHMGVYRFETCGSSILIQLFADAAGKAAKDGPVLGVLHHVEDLDGIPDSWFHFGCCIFRKGRSLSLPLHVAFSLSLIICLANKQTRKP